MYKIGSIRKAVNQGRACACLMTRSPTGSEYDACMEAPQQETSDEPLEVMLRRSDELHQELLHLLDGAEFDPSPRGEAAFGMCSVALEHGRSLRALMAMG